MSAANVLPDAQVVQPPNLVYRGAKSKGPSPFKADLGVELFARHSCDSDPAWNAFVAYRDLGSNRSQMKAIKTLGKRTGYRTLLAGWSRKNGWIERAHAWDNHLDEIEREGKIFAIRKTHEEMATTAEGLWKFAGDQLVNYWAMAEEEAKEAKLQGRAPKPVIRANQLVDMLETGIKLHRLLNNETTENIKLDATVEVKQVMDFGDFKVEF